MPRKAPLLDRLSDKFLVGDGCWEWIGAKTHGYGTISTPRPERLTRYAHIVLYELMVGAVPKGLELDHLCRNKGCVRPGHLEAVTHQENLQRHHDLKTMCGAGLHDWVPGNIYVRKNGWKMCRLCHQERAREWNASR